MFIESIDPYKLRPEMLLAFSALESQGFPGGLGKRRGEGCWPGECACGHNIIIKMKFMHWVCALCNPNFMQDTWQRILIHWKQGMQSTALLRAAWYLEVSATAEARMVLQWLSCLELLGRMFSSHLMVLPLLITNQVTNTTCYLQWEFCVGVTITRYLPATEASGERCSRQVSQSTLDVLDEQGSLILR